MDLCKCADSPEHLLLAIPQRLRWSCANLHTPQSICCSLFPKDSGGAVEMCRLPKVSAAHYSQKTQVDLGKCADSPEHLLLAIPQKLSRTCGNVQTIAFAFPKGSGGPVQIYRLHSICCSLFHNGSGVGARYYPRLRWTCANMQIPQSICCSLFPRAFATPIHKVRI